MPRSFTSAGPPFGQPQVSRHVRRLEGSLGVLLFDRDSRRTTLTDAGRALLPDAHDELMAGRGTYAELFELQARAYA